MTLAGQIGSLDHAGPAPLYRRLEKALREAIQYKRLSPNDALPAERDLAAEFGVSRITVRKALAELVAEGLLIRRQGAGTFVAARVEKSFSKLTSFTEDMILRGKTPHSRWIARTHGAVTPGEALTLGHSPGTPVFRFHRVRYADGVPMAVEYTTVAAFALASPEAVGASLYEALDAVAHRPTRALQRLSAVLITPRHTMLLGVSAPAAGLLVERRGFLGDGRPVEISQSYYRGDAYDFVTELNEANAIAA